MPKEQKGDMSEIPARLKKCGLKVTQTRVALMRILMAEHGPFTAEELRSEVTTRGVGKACDLVTVYRCLEKFEDAGLVDRCDFGDGSMRYEIRSQKHHHHIICRQCQRIEPLSHCMIEDSVSLPDIGFKNVTHRLEFFGICPDCS